MIEYSVQTVKTDHFEMDYIKFGTGSRPLVLLPGMSLKSTMGIASMVVDSYKIFADDFTVYLFDRKKNFGESYLMEEMFAKPIAKANPSACITHPRRKADSPYVTIIK